MIQKIHWKILEKSADAFSRRCSEDRDARFIGLPAMPHHLPHHPASSTSKQGVICTVVYRALLQVVGVDEDGHGTIIG